MELNKQLSFCSYNLKNYDDIIEKIDGVNEKSSLEKMFNESTFLILQETWLTESEFIRKFKNQFPESECISANKMDDDDVKLGGPYRGVGICYNSKLKYNVDTITTVSKSIWAQTYV